MAFEWHDHHFINGIACLDFANTVVYRTRAERREDRLGSLADIRSWLLAAGLATSRRPSLSQVVALRESIDALFREAALSRSCSSNAWGRFFAQYSRLARGHALERTLRGLGPAEPAKDGIFVIAHSALSLALSHDLERVKICGGCGWLFLDRTRNGRKKWCISSMCGSRDKARRYYARKALLPTSSDKPEVG